MILSMLTDQLLDRLQFIKLKPKSILWLGSECENLNKVYDLFPKAMIKAIQVDNVRYQKDAFDLILSVGEIGFSTYPPELLLKMLTLLLKKPGLVMFCALTKGTVTNDKVPVWKSLNEAFQWSDAFLNSDLKHPVLDVFRVKINRADWINELLDVYPAEFKHDRLALESVFCSAWSESEGTMISVDQIKSSKSQRRSR